jgi:hypothetical protein
VKSPRKLRISQILTKKKLSYSVQIKQIELERIKRAKYNK